MATVTREGMKNKIAYALGNAENMSPEELKQIYAEAIDFMNTLPEKEQGKFDWESCLECLTMIVLGFDYRI